MMDLPMAVLETPAIVYEAQYVQYADNSQSAEDMLLALLADTAKKGSSPGGSTKGDDNASHRSKNNVVKKERKPFYNDTKIINPEEIDVELKKLREEYKRRFGRNVEFYMWACRTCENPMTDEDRIVLLNHALKNDTPFSGEYLEAWYGDIALAKYELHFNRKIHTCQYTKDACQERTLFHNYPGFFIFEYDTSGCSCAPQYLLRVLDRALHITNEPLPENIVVTALDLWMARYRFFAGENAFPAWFDECSYKDKLLLLKYTIDKGPGPDNHVFFFLTKKEEDSIKIALKKAVAINEKRLGRKMTELEKVKTEYVVQFRSQAPTCECPDDELLIYLKHCIKYNRQWFSSEPIKKYHVDYIISGEWWEYVKRKYK